MLLLVKLIKKEDKLMSLLFGFKFNNLNCSPNNMRGLIPLWSYNTM